ncbi:hypothetical protein ACVNHC_16350 [Pannonibacter sp. Q-1]
MYEIGRIRALIDEKRAEFSGFLELVKKVAEDAEKFFGKSVILRVYSRSAKQGDSEIKEPLKILLACERPISLRTLLQVTDIIGITIVVQYLDQIPMVLDFMKGKLEEKNVLEEYRKEHKEIYFATHSIFRSKGALHHNIPCEVQCKTMLHDAWSAKMHDLTYKPQGSLDDRIKELVESVSQAIEGIEYQSKIMRDMITSRQISERRPFDESLQVLFKGVSSVIQDSWGSEGTEEFFRIAGKIRDNSSKICECEIDDGIIRDLWNEILPHCASGPNTRFGWVLFGELIACRPHPVLVQRFQEIIDEFLHNINTSIPSEEREVEIFERELTTIPLLFYVVQDFQRAFEYTERIMNDNREIIKSERRKLIMKFNRLTWLCEREILNPSKRERKEEIKVQVLEQLEELKASLDEEMASSFEDTEGLVKIVFGETKADIREGIDLCIKSAQDAPDEEAEVAAAYAEWRMQVGWRRYFDLAERN